MTEFPHVFVDATSIPRDRGGVGRYLEGLLPALGDRGVPMSIAVQSHDAEWMRELVPGAAIVTPGGLVARRPLRLLWEQLGLPRAARRAGASVIFDPHYTLPLFTRLPRVVTFHDATFFSHPEHHGDLKRLFFRTWTRLSLRRASVGVTPSEATRDELVTRVKAQPARLVVAPHGVDLSGFHRPDDPELADAATRVGAEHWIAFLGTLEPRKNVRNLVRALPIVLADPRIADRYPGLTLALIGGKGWDEELSDIIVSSPVSESIRRLGYVPNTDLRGLLGGSAVVAYPSLAEGFGLPLIEAMACGVPVLTTRSLALPEVGGDVAYYTDPDAESIAAALIEVLLAGDREERGEAGIARAAEFTWERSATAHVDAFLRAQKGEHR